jgi:hypothetical protein
VRLAIFLVAAALVLAGVAVLVLDGNVRREVLASLAVVLAAMLIGFVPLRLLLKAGPDNIVAAWIASMILRMLACLSGLVLLLKKYEMKPLTCVIVVCGGYLVLLAAETIGLNRLIRNAFDRQSSE